MTGKTDAFSKVPQVIVLTWRHIERPRRDADAQPA